MIKSQQVNSKFVILIRNNVIILISDIAFKPGVDTIFKATRGRRGKLL